MKSNAKQTTRLNQKAKTKKWSVRYHVLIKILTFEGKQKIPKKFEESQPNLDIPVFVISDDEGNENTVHRNLIIPTGTRKEPFTGVRLKVKEKTKEK